jgi:hypothetical protein
MKKFTERRTVPSKPKKFKEKRADMKIISRANQADMYLWCFTVAASLGIILIFLTIAIMKG